MKNKAKLNRINRVFFYLLSIIIIEFVSFAAIDVEMVLSDGGFVSYDRFKAELHLNNHDALVPDGEIFGILQVLSEYYYWPAFSQDVDFQTMDIVTGESRLTFVEFDLPELDDMILFGPMIFWGAWFIDSENYGYDAAEFWFDSEHKWTPTPDPSTWTPTSTPPPEPTDTAVPTYTPAFTPTQTPTPPPEPTGFVYIAPGSFTMGSPSTEACRASGETQHYVTLTRGFYMMATEVTRQMWADLKSVQPTLPNDPSITTYSPTMHHPAQSITWYEAVLFANLMSVQYGYESCYYKDSGFATPVDATNYTSGTFYCNFNANGYRLPTESEWEYACRAGTTEAFSCSEPNYNSETCETCTLGTLPTLEQYCVYCANDPSFAAVVGSKLPNPAGLFDMHGNVFEWCWDWYGAYPTGSVSDPTGAISGSFRIARSGWWWWYVHCCRSARRDHSDPTDRLYSTGFRLLKSVQSPDDE